MVVHQGFINFVIAMNCRGHFTLSRVVKELNEGLKAMFDYVTQLN